MGVSVSVHMSDPETRPAERCRPRFFMQIIICDIIKNAFSMLKTAGQEHMENSARMKG